MSMASTEGEHPPPVLPLLAAPDNLPTLDSQTRVLATPVRSQRLCTSFVTFLPV